MGPEILFKSPWSRNYKLSKWSREEMSHRGTERKGQVTSLGQQANWTEQYGRKGKIGTQAGIEREDRDGWRKEIRDIDGGQSSPKVDSDFRTQSEVALTRKMA